MESVRSLRDVLGGLAGAGADADPGAALREAGHEDLPGELLAEAVVSYADTAPIEVAEHLAPFVTAYRPGEGEDDGPDPWAALDLLAGAPSPEPTGATGPTPSLLEAELGSADAGPSAGPSAGSGPSELDFGLGDRGAAAEPAPEPALGPPEADADTRPEPAGVDPSLPVAADADPYLWPRTEPLDEVTDTDGPDVDPPV